MYSIYLESWHHFQTTEMRKDTGAIGKTKAANLPQSKAIPVGRWFWTVRSDFKGPLLLELLVCNAGDGDTWKVD